MALPTLPPNVAGIINGVAGVITVLATADPNSMPAVGPVVHQYAGFALGLWGLFNSYLHFTSPATPGALGQK